MTTSKIIKKMAQKISQDIQTFPDQRQREALVSELLHKVVITSSNLLDDSQHSSWNDLGYEEQMRIASSLMTGLEENAFLLADTMVAEKTVDERFKNVCKCHEKTQGAQNHIQLQKKQFHLGNPGG